MKNITIAFLFASCTIAFAACTKGDLLDPKTNTDLNEATVFSDSARTIDFLMGIYTEVGYTFSYRRYGNIYAGTAEAGDEAMGRLNGPTQPFVYILSSNISPSFTIPYDNAWNAAWTNIRRANVFLGHVNNSPISAALKAQSAAEARFLRAWYYSILLKNFGGVPLLGDRLFGASDDLQIPRNTYEECVDYIVKELNDAAAVLPVDHLAQDYGRITKGACLALKSRVLLFAASPLFNGGGIATDAAVKALTSYPAFDAGRWQKAAAAALDVINLNTYSLLEDNVTSPGFGFSKVFLTRKNSEYIFAGMQASGKNMEQNFLPPSRGNTTPQSVPTHNLAEAFGMIDGKPILDGGPISKSPLYNPNDPFVNRDPRFNYTFIYNGTLWYRTASNSKEPLYTYENAPQDGYKTVAWATGYYWRKMMSDGTAQNGGPNTERCLPLIRYAEILLNYAEAINETGNINLAYEQLRLVRKRAGILPGTDNLYGLKSNMIKDEMRTVIMNERRVELAFEDHRFWDVRRWKTAPVDLNITMYAIKIVKTGTTTYTYAKEVVNANSVHKFRDMNYLFPIMASEISRNRALVQNPGY